VKAGITHLLIVLLAPLVALADGGAVQMRETSGPFIVTVFVATEPLRVGPIDTSVLVQDRETGRAILDATVKLAFQPAAGLNSPLLIRATHGAARNKLLQAATIDVPAPGWWSLRVFVCRGREEAVLATRLLVVPAAPRLATMWPSLILPPFAIGLFVLHQRLRRTRLR
jgi:hypothetical protein